MDLDGTIYLDNTVIDGAVQCVSRLKEAGKRVVFVTNNSSKSNTDYRIKLNKMGIDASENDIITSIDSAARLLNKRFFGKKVYCLGTQACKTKLAEYGINLSEDDAQVVLVAYDTTLTYSKLCTAVTLIAQGATYIVTHSDINCPASPVFLPDVGSFIALIEKSCGRLPDIDCGKPYDTLAQLICERFGLEGEKVAFVGDRLYTDMLFATNSNFISVLVLSGETTREQAEQSNQQIDYIFDSVADILK